MNELIESAKAVIDMWEKRGIFHVGSDHMNALRAAVERAGLENQNETDLFTYAKGYEDGKQYVTHRVKRVLDGQPVPASMSIDCGLFEVKDKSTVTNLNLADGVYRLFAIREEV